MNKTRSIVVVVVFGLVILFGVGQFFAIPPSSENISGDAANQATPSVPSTKVVTYIPTTPSSSVKSMNGSCWTSSIAAPFRKDAWRCTVGNSISDPCFQIPGSKNLFCGANPAVASSSSAFVLKLTKPLPAPEVAAGEVPAGWAWLIKLSDGTVCSPFTGTLPIAEGGISANYGCAPKKAGEEGLLIFGDLNTGVKPWTAEVGFLSISTSGLPTIKGQKAVSVDTVWQ